MPRKVALVTGGNKGIGLGTVVGLARKFDGDVYLTARNEVRGKAALGEVRAKGFNNVHFHQLDINDIESIRKLRDFMSDKYGGLDVVVNNAAIAFKRAATEPFGVQAEVTLATNYWATKNVCQILFEILRPGARVVNVSSYTALLSCMEGKEPMISDLKKKFSSPTLTVTELDKLMNDFVDAAKRGTHIDLGWPPRSYQISKIGVSALTAIQAREFAKHPEKDIVVNHVNPGFVDTDMTSHKGTKTIEEGAKPSIYAALLPPKTEIRGKFIWEDCRTKDWVGD